MAINADTASMALFCDFENIALGVRDAQYEKFDIRPVLERLLAKGSIVVKKAYCDWDRYKGFKSAMHEANFELIEIPHVRQSGKNSADIRMVVDALDLCYTKAHVDIFVIISGDSDFSPLVSKLRENAKKVIGVGVKQSCSDLLVTNCDEFIYYDDLVRDREAERAPQRREREKRSPEEEQKRREKQEERKSQAVEIVHATFVDLVADRGESERIWASVLKEVVKRRNPGFNESYYGFRSFGNLLEEAAGRGLLGFGRDDKGAYVTRVHGRPAASETEMSASVEAETAALVADAVASVPGLVTEIVPSRRRGGRRTRKDGDAHSNATQAADDGRETSADVMSAEAAPADAAEPPAEATVPVVATGRTRGGRSRRSRSDAAAAPEVPVTTLPALEPAAVSSAEAAGTEMPVAAKAKPQRSRGGRQPRQDAAPAEPKAKAVPAREKAASKTAAQDVAATPKAARKARPARGRKAEAAGE